MELYIGGYAQGKLHYVKEKYQDYQVVDETNFYECFGLYGEADSKVLVNSEKIIWNHFHLCVKVLLMKNQDVTELKKTIEDLYNNEAKVVIISDEIGNGIVPIEKFDRLYREETGRLLEKIASKATAVGRITCGICQYIK